ncbi:MAG: energy-coupling factor ABC transporter ATP-binding protein [Micrococcales bacterium]|nr:energy-coupling factor ABC transporter ATP-binding protein [Micrococcales bacterium]
MLSCEDVSYSYLDRFPALDEVSLDVLPGQRLALLGANGCGKTTLLKVLAGLVFPTTGTVSAFGRPLTEDALADAGLNAAFRARVGLCFQNPDVQVFSPTVREEVAFGPLQLGLPTDEALARTTQVLELLGVADLADRTPMQLSGGQKKKVAIASVLATNPEVLLFDEPTAALDPRSRLWLEDLLATLAASGTAIVSATHDLDRLTHVADRAVVLAEDHRVLADAPTTEILADHDLLVTANLVAPG